MRLKSVAVSFLLAILTQAALSQVGHYLDLKVYNGTNQVRTGEPVSFGIPVAQGNNLHYLDWFQIVDANDQAVPVQFKTLSRWGGDRSDVTKPIRWALATFPATVPANGAATYRVAINAPYVHGDLYASDQLNFIEVHTTATTFFRIAKWQFKLFDTAVVNGTSLVNPGRLDMVLADGSHPTPVITECVLEEYQGWRSVRAVVRQRGQLGQLRFTCRWYFHSGRSDVEVDFRLENPNAYGLFSSLPDGQVYFDSLYLVQPVISGSSCVLTTPAATRALASGDAYDLRQEFDSALQTNATDLWTGFKYTETVNGAQVAAGDRFAGAVDLKGTSGGVTVTLDRFWQNFPKSFKAQSGEIQIGLFPEWGNGPEYKGQYGSPTSTTPTDPMSLSNYRYEGGRWKTGRMVFNFHTGTTTTSAVGQECDRVNAPLIGSADPAWIRVSRATGDLWMERRQTPDVGEARWEQFTDMLATDSAADPVAGQQIGFPALIRRGGTYGGQQSYGWENYGDIPWADGYCAQHYDWSGVFMDGFWRTGDYRIFDKGRDVVASRRDYNQNHSTNLLETWRGCQFYEKGWWHGNYTPGLMSHNWLEGLLMFYAMTGDESSREAAIENANYILANPPKNWDGHWGSRLLGWSVDNLMAAYAYLGSPVYLNEAGLGVHRYEQLELADGGLGCVINPANGLTTGWMENIVHIAACKYYLTSGDATVLPLLSRMRNWFRNEICIPPVGTFPNFTLAMVHETWAPGAPGNIVVHHAWAMSQSLAYSAVVFNDYNDLAWSVGFFNSAARFWQASVGVAYFNATNPSAFSPITFHPSQYPNTESKVISNVLRWGSAQLAARHWMTGY